MVQAQISDGALHLIMTPSEQTNRSQLLNLLLKVEKGTHIDLKCVEYQKVLILMILSKAETVFLDKSFDIFSSERCIADGRWRTYFFPNDGDRDSSRVDSRPLPTFHRSLTVERRNQSPPTLNEQHPFWIKPFVGLKFHLFKQSRRNELYTHYFSSFQIF